MVDTKIIARPWQPQDLIDDLQGIIDEECDNYMNTRRTTLCMARDYLKEHFAEPKWISVKDRLPEDDSDVLAYLQIGEESRIYPANYAKGMWFDCLFNTPATDSTTHWMPLPQPPKGE